MLAALTTPDARMPPPPPRRYSAAKTHMTSIWPGGNLNPSANLYLNRNSYFLIILGRLRSHPEFVMCIRHSFFSTFQVFDSARSLGPFQSAAAVVGKMKQMAER